MAFYTEVFCFLGLHPITAAPIPDLVQYAEQLEANNDTDAIRRPLDPLTGQSTRKLSVDDHFNADIASLAKTPQQQQQQEQQPSDSVTSEKDSVTNPSLLSAVSTATSSTSSTTVVARTTRKKAVAVTKPRGELLEKDEDVTM